MMYRLVEWETRKHGTITAPNVTILEGPIEDALIVTVADEMLQHLISLGPERTQAFVDRTRKIIEDAGWKGEIIVCSDDMKFAKFEPMEPLPKMTRPPVELPTLPEIEAKQSKVMQEIRDEEDRKIIESVKRSLGGGDEKVCPHCGDPGCAGAVYDPGDCPKAP